MPKLLTSGRTSNGLKVVEEAGAAAYGEIQRASRQFHLSVSGVPISGTKKRKRRRRRKVPKSKRSPTRVVTSRPILISEVSETKFLLKEGKRLKELTDGK